MTHKTFMIISINAEKTTDETQKLLQYNSEQNRWNILQHVSGYEESYLDIGDPGKCSDCVQWEDKKNKFKKGEV